MRMRYPTVQVVTILVASIASIALFLVSAFLVFSQAHAVDISTSVLIAVCGDGFVGPAEACDDGVGNNTGEYSTTTAGRTCMSDCLSFGPYCGDEILQARFDEECDEGGSQETATCSAQCKAKTPPPPGVVGSPSVGSIPPVPGGVEGTILSETETKVVVRGKAYPSARVNVLLDGKVIGTVQADANADFLFSTQDVTPGTATFGFSARDSNNTDSLLVAVVFEVAQGAVTTMSNILIPPTVALSDTQLPSGELLTVSGQSIPGATVVIEISAAASQPLTYEAETDGGGDWALQLDTSPLANGVHLAKAYFNLGTGSARSGFGRAISFRVGDAPAEGTGLPDINDDDRINLVDFSIFLTDWGTDNPRSDFNGDGTINLADFSILLFQWTG